MSNEYGRRRIELILVCLRTQSSNKISVDGNWTLQSVRLEFMWSCISELGEGDIPLYDLLRDRFISSSTTVLEAELTDHDVLVLDAYNYNLFDDDPDEPSELNSHPIIENIEEAVASIKAFDHYSYEPKSFVCRVTSSQFDQMINIAVSSVVENSLFDGKKIIYDLMYTADIFFQRNRRNTVELIRDRVLGTLQDGSIDLPNDIEERIFRNSATYHLFCNGAALHIEPAIQDSDSLIQVLNHGNIEIGEIQINTFSIPTTTIEEISL